MVHADCPVRVQVEHRDARMRNEDSHPCFRGKLQCTATYKNYVLLMIKKHAAYYLIRYIDSPFIFCMDDD